VLFTNFIAGVYSFEPRRFSDLDWARPINLERSSSLGLSSEGSKALILGIGKD